MNVAAIDIGTNTVLMLVGEVDPAGNVVTVRDEHEIARLGRGVDAERQINDSAVEGVIAILLSYLKIAETEGCRTIVACGTSALRDAVNSRAVLDQIRSRTGITVSVLSGDEEAGLTYRGALSGFPEFASAGDTTVLDIGGGSTEIVTGRGARSVHRRSINIGAVRLTERYFKDSPPHPIDFRTAQGSCREAFEQLPPFGPKDVCVAVAGTPTTLAAVAQQLDVYDRSRVEGYVLSRARVDNFLDEFMVLSLDELRRIPAVHPQRADILLAGTLILREFLFATSLTGVTVSDRGLRYGILLDAVSPG